MSHAIHPAYSYGDRIIPPDHVETLAQRILDDPRADYAGGADLRFAFDNLGMSRDGQTFGEWHLVILSAHTGYGAEILDYSNAAAIERIYRGYTQNGSADSWLTLDVSGQETRLSIPLTDEIEAEMFEKGVENAEFWADVADALGTAEGLSQYPILDDDDYSQREDEAWVEALNDGLRFLGFDPHEDDALKIARLVDDNYRGYSDPGFVDTDWIRRACIALGITIPID